jgi:hypothetical protein
MAVSSSLLLDFKCVAPDTLFNELRGKAADVHNDSFTAQYTGEGAVFVKLSWEATSPPEIPRGKAFVRVEHPISGGGLSSTSTLYATIDYSSSHESSWYLLTKGRHTGRSGACVSLAA